MRKNAPDALWDNAWSKIVLLYLGCKLNQIECGGIKKLINKVVLAGTSGKKLTFASVDNVFEAQELMDFVEDYTYERMHYFLYHKGKLNIDIIKKCEDWESEKSLFFHMINIIYKLDFLDEIDDADVWLALTRGVDIQSGTLSYMSYIPNYCKAYRFKELIQKAISDYEKIIKS